MEILNYDAGSPTLVYGRFGEMGDSRDLVTALGNAIMQRTILFYRSKCVKKRHWTLF